MFCDSSSSYTRTHYPKPLMKHEGHRDDKQWAKGISVITLRRHYGLVSGSFDQFKIQQSSLPGSKVDRFHIYYGESGIYTIEFRTLMMMG